MSSGMQPTVRTITQAQIDAYAAASRDHNAIHTDTALAAASPFGGTIAHGMLVLALIGETMHNGHGEAWRRTGSMKVRFKAPTRPGDTVTASASAAREANGTLEYVVQCVNQRGETLIEGRASVTDDGRSRPAAA
jgi:3-hydroxybutyryl-CoA dehydratase